MNVGVRLPQYGSTWDDIRSVASLCEARGFAGLWVNDHLRSPGRMATDTTFEALTTLAAIAQHTTRCSLGIAVVSSSYRHPALLTRSLATIDAMASGRLIVGLGTGSDKSEHQAYGFDFPPRDKRTERLTDTLQVMRALTDNPDGATLDGILSNAPNQPPANPPIWIAAHKPGLLRIAGQRGDGIVGAFVDPDTFAARLAIAHEARTETDAPFACCLYTFALPISSDTPRWLTPQADVLGTTPSALLRWLSTTGIVAPIDEMRDRLDEFRTAGATDVVLALPERLPLDAWDALADAVL